MNELQFRGRDLLRATRGQLVVPAFALAVQMALAAILLDAKTALLETICLTAFLALLALIGYRSWSRVGPEGITICLGLGSGRTIPWHEIRWITTYQSSSMPNAVVRITLTNGRRRTLAALSSGAFPSDDEFEATVRQIVDWWECNTDAASRVAPTGRRIHSRDG